MTIGHMTSKKRRKRTCEVDMDKLVKKDYAEESGDTRGWKSGVLHEPKDQVEKQKAQVSLFLYATSVRLFCLVFPQL